MPEETLVEEEPLEELFPGTIRQPLTPNVVPQLMPGPQTVTPPVPDPDPIPGFGTLPVYFNVASNDPSFAPATVPNGALVFRRQRNGVCVITTTNSPLGNQSVMIQRRAIEMACDAYRMGFRHGIYATTSPISATQNCIMVDRFCRWLDTQSKLRSLPHNPSFPRKKSKTGVTRTGRKRRGPG